MTKVADEKVLVLDFGSQYAQLIARRARPVPQKKVYWEMGRHDIPAARIRELQPKGIILSGGPASVYEPGAPTCDARIFDMGIPGLGICYGMQVRRPLRGGKVIGAAHREFGRAHVRVAEANGIFAGVPNDMVVWMSHGDQVQIV